MYSIDLDIGDGTIVNVKIQSGETEKTQALVKTTGYELRFPHEIIFTCGDKSYSTALDGIPRLPNMENEAGAKHSIWNIAVNANMFLNDELDGWEEAESWFKENLEGLKSIGLSEEQIKCISENEEWS